MGRLTVFLGLAFFVLAISAQRGSRKPSKQATKNDRRIIGGVVADFRKYGFIVSLQWMSNGESTCAGSIISSQYILTAAHCTIDVAPSELRVVAGTPNLRVTTTLTQRRAISAIINHPQYNTRTKDNDISLIRLSTPLQLNEIVRAVELDRNEAPDYDHLFIAGWGRWDPNLMDSSYILKAVAVPKVPRAECQKEYNIIITNNMICAGVDEVSDSVCNGDSGGPAISFSTQKQVGIVSWGNRPCGTEIPDVYVNVARYIPWIRSLTGLQL